MSEMVERVARAMCGEVERVVTLEFVATGQPPAWSQMGCASLADFINRQWPAYAAQARVAIAAMREPTQAMINTGEDVREDKSGEVIVRGDAEEIFRAMIDEALK